MPSTGNQFAIFRIKKLRTPEEISKVGNHNDRRGKIPDNVDPKRVALNRSFIKDDRPLLDRVQAKLADKKFRHDAVKAVEIVCAFSPGCEKFVPVEKWAITSIDFIKKQFGADNLISAVLHRDEKTPHLQCVIVPLIGEKLAAKRIFGTRQKLRELQTSYHQAVKQYGLERGTKGSDRPHLNMAEIYQETQEGRVIVQKALASMPQKTIIQSKEGYQKELDQYFTEALEPLATAKTAATLAALELDSLRRVVGETERAQKLVQERLRSLDLSQVAERLLGYSGIKDGKSTVYEDDARKIVITGNSFRDLKSKARGERGAISLTRHILEVDFETAVRTLSQHFPEDAASVEAEAVREAEAEIKASVKKSAREEVDNEAKLNHFAKPDPDKLPTVIEYLEKVRGIPRNIINTLVSESRLWSNRWGAACFKRESADGQEKGVTIFNTSTNRCHSLGDKNAVFHIGIFDSGKPLAVVESPIDALSYHALTGARVVTADTVTPAKGVIEFLKAIFTKNVIAAHRGDKAGEETAEVFITEAKKMGVIPTREKPPKGQSWNEALLHPLPSPEMGKVPQITSPIKKGPSVR